MIPGAGFMASAYWAEAGFWMFVSCWSLVTPAPAFLMIRSAEPFSQLAQRSGPSAEAGAGFGWLDGAPPIGQSAPSFCSIDAPMMSAVAAGALATRLAISGSACAAAAV